MSADDESMEHSRANPIRADRGDAGEERRINPVLRAQVEDMLASIRSAASIEEWTDEERARHASSMARIMELVREHALSRGRHR